MPQLWHDSIDAHRSAVRDAALDAAAALISDRGLTSVTMSGIAARAGIGRATLYKYFSDVDAVLTAWHERQVTAHLSELGQVSQRPGTPSDRLRAVLQAYADLSHRGHSGSELAALLHQPGDLARHQNHVRDLVAALITEGAKTGGLRVDVPPAELATFCLHALTAATAAPSRAARHRLVDVTLDALRAPHTS